MDKDDPLVTIRMQYVEDLEDILQCPVCWELPTTGLMIFTCVRGHHVCENCQTANNLQECPTCKSNFNGSRNYLAESLSSKFEDIKSSILEPSNYINRKIVKKHIEIQTDQIETICANTQTEVDNNSVFTQTNFSEFSIGTQTDEFNIINNAATQMDEKSGYQQQPIITEKKIKDTLTSMKKDEYKIACLFENCEDKCSLDSIVSHIEIHHKDNLIEVDLSKNGLSCFEWNILYEKNKSFDYALTILNVGLIFFNVFINTEGDLYGNIEVVNSYCKEQTLYYALLITNVQNFLKLEVFKGIVPLYSSNTSKNNNNARIFIPSTKFSHYLLNEENLFNCSLTIYQPPEF